MARHPYLDSCPRCGQRGNRPESVHTTSAEGVSAYYRCGKCRYVWQTGWQRASKGTR